jgi:arginyl-tRNA synthetase
MFVESRANLRKPLPRSSRGFWCRQRQISPVRVSSISRSSQRLDAALRVAVMAGGDYGRSDIGGEVPVNVEYVSANPTGPMHVGHGRGAVFGDALANLLAFTGFKVTREYYVNDAGAQVDQLARSAYLRYREALGENIGAIPEGLYPGEYLKPVGLFATRGIMAMR